MKRLCTILHGNVCNYNYTAVFLMAHQMAQEGALWPSVMITLGLCWRTVKLHLLAARKCVLILMLYIITIVVWCNQNYIGPTIS